MLERLARVIVGIILVVTLPITVIPFLLLWIGTGTFWINNIAEWCILGDERNE